MVDHVKLMEIDIHVNVFLDLVETDVKSTRMIVNVHPVKMEERVLMAWICTLVNAWTERKVIDVKVMQVVSCRCLSKFKFTAYDNLTYCLRIMVSA